MAQTASRFTVISSDGHANARMPDYRPYLESRWHEQFDAFVKVHAEKGSRNFDPPTLLRRTDDDTVERWTRDMVVTGRLDGNSDPARRLVELEAEGVAAEILFPDFGVPFELYPPFLASALGYPARTPEEIDAASRAYNRWLVDFCSYAPGRFAGMALVSFDDVDAAVREIRWAKAAGLKGVLLPEFDEARPLYDPVFDPIWSVLEELELPANCHVALSGTQRPKIGNPSSLPHPTAGFPIFHANMVFFARQIFSHMVWGGVFARHPDLRIAFTEMGSGWVVHELRWLDYTWEGSYLRRDIREVATMKPSEYFERHCFLGSSLLARAEVEARHDIGLTKMMVGVDYPHHEGAWNGGTQNYLQATLGAAGVPEAEARTMLGETAAAVFGFDFDELSRLAQEFGPAPESVLVPPTEDLFPRGDIHRPV